jgi:protein ImuA
MFASADGQIMQTGVTIVDLGALRSEVAGVERRGSPDCGAQPMVFGLASIDAALPGGGVAVGAVHEVAGTGPQVEHGTAAALLAAGLLARVSGEVLWVLEQRVRKTTRPSST